MKRSRDGHKDRAERYRDLYLQESKACLDWIKRCMQLASELERVAKKSPLTESTISDLLMLCHPDKHNGSARSERITKWLLEQRKRT